MRLKTIIALSVLGLFGCKKNTEDPYSYESLKKKNNGACSASINGNAWNSNLLFAKVDPNSTSGKIYFEAFIYENGIQRQSISFTGVDPNVSSQRVYSYFLPSKNGNLTPRSFDTLTSSIYLVNADVTENYYDIVDTPDGNSFQIDYYNPSTQELRGRFSIYAIRGDKDKKAATQGFADTLIITNGTFDFKYTK